MDLDAAGQANRANWDVWAGVHGRDGYYDSAALICGADSLTDVERCGLEAAVGVVDELEIVHVQCHLGFDAISLARRGARVTGVDFSAVALDKARDLAARSGVDIEFVEADVTALPTELHGRFDLAYATIGILCWIADAEAWMRSVAATLKPGGRLLIIDLHPLTQMVRGVDPLVLGFPYAFDGPHVFDAAGSYAAASDATTNVQFAHSLGEIVTAAVSAGLRIVRLDEHLDTPFAIGDDGVADADGRFRLTVSGYRLPALYTLIAEAQAQAEAETGPPASGSPCGAGGGA